jgi:hypothetical protein
MSERVAGLLEGCGFTSQMLDLLLQLFLNRLVEAGELNAHPYSAIAGPDNRGCVNTSGIEPEAHV